MLAANSEVTFVTANGMAIEKMLRKSISADVFYGTTITPSIQEIDQHVPQSQSQIKNENRSFSTVINVMKTKHNTAKSSISNVR